jgi:hypothetical protein
MRVNDMDIKDYHKKYYSRPEIKEKHSEYMKKYYQKNRELLLEKQKKYNKSNKSSYNEYMKKYMKHYNSDKNINKSSKLINISQEEKIQPVTDQD